MNHDILDPRRQMLIGALYEELSPEEQGAFEALLEEDASLRADWEELRETRRVLAEASGEETATGFDYLAEDAAAAGDSPGFLARLRAGFRGGWIPAWSFAGATLMLLVMLGAGFRIDRVDGGLVFRFGPGPEITGSDGSAVTTLAGGAEPLDMGRYADPGRVTAAPAAATGGYLTRSDLDGYTVGVMQAVSGLLGSYQEEQRGEIAFILQGLYEQLRMEQRRDFEKLRARVDGVGLGMMMEQNRTRERMESLVATRTGPEPSATVPGPLPEEGNHD
jgi:hypothetical protein